MGRLLAKTRLVNPDFIPDMPEKPLLPPGLVEALAEAKAHKKRGKEAYAIMQKREAWLKNEANAKGRASMRFRRMNVPLKMFEYIKSKILSRTTGVVADMFHQQAEHFESGTLLRSLNETAANLIGGDEWRRTYEDRNAWAALYQLVHLQGSPHVVRDGWCMYHGVWGPPGLTGKLGGLDPKAYKPHGKGMCEFIKGALAILQHPRRKIVVTEGATDGFTISVRVDGGAAPYTYVWFYRAPGDLRFQEADASNVKQTGDMRKHPVRREHEGTYYCEVTEHDPETDEKDPWADEGTAPSMSPTESWTDNRCCRK